MPITQNVTISVVYPSTFKSAGEKPDSCLKSSISNIGDIEESEKYRIVSIAI